MGLSSRIVDFSQLHRVDEELVGKKAHELGELWKLGIPLPKGFVITTQFQKDFLRINGIDKEIKKTQALMHPALSDSLDKLFQPVRRKIMHTKLPRTFSQELHRFYRFFSGTFRNQSLNAFSSSLKNKLLVFSNVKGDANLVLKIKTIWSSFLDQPAAIIVRENPKAQTKGKIVTDNPIADKNLTEKQMLELIKYCKIIQKHFYFPKEIEYAVSKGKILIVKISPFTGTPTVKNSQLRKVLAKGIPLNSGIVTGLTRIFNSKYDWLDARKGEIVVLHNFNNKSLKKIRKAKAVIIDGILPNSLLKALCRRDLRIPAIEGIKNATKTFQDGKIITVNGVNGEIYSGGIIY